jgi:hypothetical protein
MFTLVNMMPLVLLILAHHAYRFFRMGKVPANLGTFVPLPPGSLPS